MSEPEKERNRRSHPIRSPSENTAVILVVEGCEANRYALVRHLQRAGYQTVEAETGSQAIESVQQNCPDLILLDVTLPDMSGYEIVARLRTHCKSIRIPVIHTSVNFTPSKDHLRGIENGADGFLTAPIDPLVLISTIKAWVRASKAEKERERLIQEREDALKELHRTQALFGAVLDQMPVGVSAAEAPTGKCLIANKAAIELLGYDFSYRKDLNEYASYGAIHPDGSFYRAEEYPTVRALTKGEIIQGEELRYLRADGHEFLMSLNSRPVRDEQGKIMAAVSTLQDITAQKQAERALQQSEERLRLALLAGRMGAWQINLKTHHVTRSPELAAIFDVDQEHENVFEDMDRLVHPEDLERVKRRWMEAAESCKPILMEYRILKRDGSIRWVEVRGETNYDSNGEPICYTGIAMDITERKEAQLAVERERELLYNTFMDAPVAFAVHRGLELITEFANRLYLSIIGATQDIRGKTLSEAIPSINSEQIALHRNVITTGRPYRSIEFSVVLDYDRNGKPYERIWNLVYQSVRDIGGRVDGVMTCAFEVTEQVRARKKIEASERELANQQQKLEAVFMNAAGPMALLRGPDFIYEMCNSMYQSLLPGREIKGPILQVIPELKNTPIPQGLIHAYKTGEVISLKAQPVWLKKPNSEDLEERHFDISFSRITDSEGKPYGIINLGVEVTDVVKHKKEVEKIVQDLRQERDLRERFVATLTHDLRTPLTAAKMSTQLLARKSDDPAVIQMISGRIADNINRADQMIRDLLDANRLRAGEKLPIQINACDLNQIASEVLEELSTLHGDRFVLHASSHIEGYWSGSGMRRILENLCNNAIKYGAPYRPIMITLKSMDQNVEISVHNEGSPISPEDQNTLFQPYRRTESAQIGKQRGWGLGLTLVRGIAEAHGGWVKVESSVSEGTTFSVQLPIDARNL